MAVQDTGKAMYKTTATRALKAVAQADFSILRNLRNITLEFEEERLDCLAKQYNYRICHPWGRLKLFTRTTHSLEHLERFRI